ncbi:MAG: glycosyltransferase family 4 protein [Syntrophobacteraceae bacterium]
MHILFLTHYFPPEVNAPASRTFENAKRWVGAGHKVTVLTCAPNHPRGILYPGYKNRLFQWDTLEGIQILRVFTFLSPNAGFLKRIFNYFSYMLSATLLCPLVSEIDVVVSTSPQFFCGMAGLWVSLLKRKPWVLEIRDLWPESITAVGQVINPILLRFLERLETFLYKSADHIISVTHSFKQHIGKRGIPGERISVLTNGVDLEHFQPVSKKDLIRSGNGHTELAGKFVVSYIGTHGMAHGLETVLLTAEILRPYANILFLLIGDGAERETLLRKRNEAGLENVLMLPQQPKEKMPEFLALSDACMVLLKKRDIFKTVIPSKIFESMGMERPVILGVAGESKGIIEEADCGICIEPENHQQLADAVLKLFNDPELAAGMGRNGRRCVTAAYNRETLAGSYLGILDEVSKVQGKISGKVCRSLSV